MFFFRRTPARLRLDYYLYLYEPLRSLRPCPVPSNEPKTCFARHRDMLSSPTDMAESDPDVCARAAEIARVYAICDRDAEPGWLDCAG